MIPFNIPPVTGKEESEVISAINNGSLSGDGEYSVLCQNWFEKRIGALKALLTPNCTQALEMAAILLNIEAGDEVIMPSYTFVSTANAFVLRGAKIVFVDIRPDTMNIDEQLIEAAITKRTKVIVPVHYAGVACEMDVIMEIANRNDLFVIEDAAQAMMCEYKGKPLGTIGHFGAYSFHATKNYTSGGEGGLLIINDSKFEKRAEIIREKGTNRSQYYRGVVDKYSWVDVGSSFLPSEIQAAYLWAQLQVAEDINDKRLELWSQYYSGLKGLAGAKKITLPSVPSSCKHNAHMFYIKVECDKERAGLIDFLKEKGVSSAFHYIPLHSSEQGVKSTRFDSLDRYTTLESEKLLRLPMYYGLDSSDVVYIVKMVKAYYGKA